MTFAKWGENEWWGRGTRGKREKKNSLQFKCTKHPLAVRFLITYELYRVCVYDLHASFLSNNNYTSAFDWKINIIKAARFKIWTRACWSFSCATRLSRIGLYMRLLSLLLLGPKKGHLIIIPIIATVHRINRNDCSRGPTVVKKIFGEIYNSPYDELEF